uniref:Protein SON-like n=1 Tax=Saccoglossus kowalevskii TaxID=10224 RepID=A0ABM0MLJ5_SACKO
NAIQKPVQDKDTLLKQFPVSSGTQHRKKEAEPNPYGDWVLVKKDFEHKPTTASSAKTFTETTPVNSTTIVPAAITATAITTAAAVVTTSTAADVAVALAAAPAVAATAAVTPAVVAPLAIAGASNDSVFPKQPSQLNVDITTMVTERLQAMRKLQENPHDVEAMGVMYKANQQIQSWAQASHKPGQYTGSTDAQILKPTELANSNPKGQAWAKK